MGSRSNYQGSKWRGKGCYLRVWFRPPWFVPYDKAPRRLAELKTSKRFQGCRKGKP